MNALIIILLIVVVGQSLVIHWQSSALSSVDENLNKLAISLKDKKMEFNDSRFDFILNEIYPDLEDNPELVKNNEVPEAGSNHS